MMNWIRASMSLIIWAKKNSIWLKNLYNCIKYSITKLKYLSAA